MNYTLTKQSNYIYDNVKLYLVISFTGVPVLCVQCGILNLPMAG